MSVLPEVSEQLEHVLVRQLAAVLPVQRREASALVQSPRGVLEHEPAGGNVGFVFFVFF